MQLRLSFYDTELTTEKKPFTGIFIIDYEEKEFEFDVSIYSKEENLHYVVANKKINHQGFDVEIDSTYMKQDGSFTLNFTVNDIKIYNSYKIKAFNGAGTFLVNSKKGFHYELMMNAEEIKKVYKELAEEREKRKLP